MRRTARVIVGLLISGALLWLAARRVDWTEAWHALAGAHYRYVLPMVAVTVWTLYIRAQRWRVFLGAVGAPPMRTLVAATNIGFMANMVLPLRMGEVIRPVLVARKERLPLSGLLATVLLERIFDMFTVLVLFGVAASVVPVSPDLRWWGWRLTAAAGTVGLGILVVRWQEARALRVVRRVGSLFPHRLGEAAVGFAAGFIKALGMLDGLGSFLRAWVWSLYLWLAIATTYVFAFFAFELPVPLATAALAVTAVVAVAVSVPSAPGYVGAFQFGCVLALGLFGVGQSRAMAYSIVVHLAQFLGVVLAGVYSLWTENLSLREVESVEEAGGAVA